MNEMNEQMKTLIKKWEGKDPKNDTPKEHAQRTIDRMRFRQLQRDMKEPTQQYKDALDIFR